MPKLTQGSSANPTRVLIYRLGSLGDTLIALPAFHLVARAFPNAERRLLTNFPVTAKAPLAAAILEHTGLIDGFFRYTVGTRNPLELLQLWWTLIRWRPQVIVHLGTTRGVENAKRDAMFFRLCGNPHLIGVPSTVDMQTHRVAADGLLEREASRLLRNIGELGDGRIDDPASWDLHLTDAEKSRAEQVLAPCAGRPLLAVSVGTKMQSKDWGRENWRALLARVAQLYPDYALALCGAGEESEASEFAAGGWRAYNPGPVLNFCGALTPRESAAVFAHAVAFLCHDSGPMHLAAAVGTPCVAVFAARNIPRVWFPFGERNRVVYHTVDCAGCRLETCIVEKKKCLTSITVDEVLSEVNAILHPANISIEVR